MNANSFFIAHGEKMVVAVVAIACGLALWSTASDKDFQPKINAEKVVQINDHIEKVLKTQQPPVMKEPRPYLDQLLVRIAQQVPTSPVMAWLLTPPDISKDPPMQAFIYVYEVLAPKVAVEDAVGQLQVSLELPVGEAGGQSRRIGNLPNQRWERKDKEQIVNTARHVGVQLEVQIGDGEWKPLVLPGASPEGVLALSAVRREVTIPAIEPWQLHRIHARIVAVATALEDVERPRKSVVVFTRPISPNPSEDVKVIENLTAQLDKHAGPLLKEMLPPLNGPLPPGVRTSAGEKVFLGGWSETAEVRVTGNIRVALEKIFQEPSKADQNKMVDKARFLVEKLFQEKGEKKWLAKPVELELGIDEKLSAKVEVIYPFSGKPIQTLIETPFVVQKLQREQQRVYWYILKPKSKPTGGRDKDLVLTRKEKLTDIVVLIDPATGKTMQLAKVALLDAPVAGEVRFPFRAGAYDERSEFIKAPNLFDQAPPIPPEPVAFQPDAGPLIDLYEARKAAEDPECENYRTNTAYYVLADRRVVWWDPIRHEMRIYDPKGIEKGGAAAAPKPMAPEIPAPAPAPKPPVAPPHAPGPAPGPGQGGPPTGPGPNGQPPGAGGKTNPGQSPNAPTSGPGPVPR